MKRGDVVQANGRITERNFPTPGKVHVHARKAELGRVRAVDGEWLTVTFDVSGTTADVHRTEVSDFRSPIPKRKRGAPRVSRC